MMSEGCMSGCYWHGSSVCSLCGDRLRCSLCGQFVREDNLDTHCCAQLTAAISDGSEI